MADRTTQLETKIKELEEELAERERDLAVFRDELAKANGRLEKFIRQVTQELKLANMIQKTLVPTEFPSIPGFEFSTKFIPSPLSGADFFDIFEHEDKFRFGIVMANSSGYSMSSLFLSVLLKLSGKMEARKGLAPDEVLTKMAASLVENIQAKDAANVFYGIVDRRRFELTYCSVGNMVGLLQSGESRRLQPLKSEHPAFASGFDEELKSQSLSLNPRDRLILCTDGILKVTNPKGEGFGRERLYKAVLGASSEGGVHDLRNEIIFQAKKFADNQDIPQDITVIVTEVKERVIKLASPEEGSS